MWPNAPTIVRADERFNESYWPEGTEMCSPVAGSSTDGTDEGTWQGALGPAYPKPFPTNWCGEGGSLCPEAALDSEDPLHTWGVSVSVIDGVILGRSNHHCMPEDDGQCYYMMREL